LEELISEKQDYEERVAYLRTVERERDLELRTMLCTIQYLRAIKDSLTSKTNQLTFNTVLNKKAIGRLR
jgi:hypothetical protein